MTIDNQLQRAILLIRLACYGFLAFAFLWWLAVLPNLDFSARFILDVSDWPYDGSFDSMSHNARFLSAIGSGLLAGVSVLLLCVVLPEIKKGNGTVVQGSVISLCVWYFVDSLGCALLGVFSNVILNTIYLALIVPPLLMAGHAINSSSSERKQAAS